MRQLVALVWLEQALLIAVGMALGTWMGGRLSKVMMPFLGNDDFGTQVIPPFAVQVDWDALAVAYSAMAMLFALIIAGVILFIRKISLHRILRLGEGEAGRRRDLSTGPWNGRRRCPCGRAVCAR